MPFLCINPANLRYQSIQPKQTPFLYLLRVCQLRWKITTFNMEKLNCDREKDFWKSPSLKTQFWKECHLFDQHMDYGTVPHFHHPIGISETRDKDQIRVRLALTRIELSFKELGFHLVSLNDGTKLYRMHSITESRIYSSQREKRWRQTNRGRQRCVLAFGQTWLSFEAIDAMRGKIISF